MARSYSVAIYTLKIKETSGGKNTINLNNKCGFNKANFYDFVESFVKRFSDKNYENKDAEQLLRIESYQKDVSGKFFIDGIVEKGDSGYETKLHNINSHKERIREKEEAELFPYYFCISETNNPEAAVLCIQRSGTVGVKTIFQDAFKKDFKENFSNQHALVVDDHLPAFCKEKFIKSNKVKNVTFSYTSKVSDVATSLEVNGERDYRTDNALVKVSICPTRGVGYSIRNTLNSDIKDILSNIKSKIVNIDDSKKLDTAITFEGKGGKTRTFRINENRDILPYVDITDEITLGLNGHPTFDSIKSAVCDILKEDHLI